MPRLSKKTLLSSDNVKMARSKARKRRSNIFPSFKNEKNEKEDSKNEEPSRRLSKRRSGVETDSKNLATGSAESMVLSQEQYDAIFQGDNETESKHDKSYPLSEEPVKLMFYLLSKLINQSSILILLNNLMPGNAWTVREISKLG